MWYRYQYRRNCGTVASGIAATDGIVLTLVIVSFVEFCFMLKVTCSHKNQNQCTAQYINSTAVAFW